MMEEPEELLAEQRPRWKEELAKMAVMAAGALVALYAIIAYSNLQVILICVFSLAAIAYFADGYTKPKNTIPVRDKAVFITGCDTGFGHQLALSLDIMGVLVFAGCYSSQSEGAAELRSRGSERMRVVQCDVTDIKQVKDACQQVKDGLDNRVLWGIVNNAGINFEAPIELSRMEDFERHMQVNYFGMVRVTKTFLPLIRHSKGRILNVTSVKGRAPTPFCGCYTPTKYAGEAFSDILRMEMRQFGVTVCVIEPCHFGSATNMVNVPRMRQQYETMWRDVPDETKHTYGEEFVEAHLKVLANEVNHSCYELWRVTRGMEDALFSLEPKSRYLIGGGQGIVDWFKVKAQLKPYLTDKLMDSWILRGFRHLPKPNLSKEE